MQTDEAFTQRAWRADQILDRTSLLLQGGAALLIERLSNFAAGHAAPACTLTSLWVLLHCAAVGEVAAGTCGPHVNCSWAVSWTALGYNMICTSKI